MSAEDGTATLVFHNTTNVTSVSVQYVAGVTGVAGEYDERGARTVSETATDAKLMGGRRGWVQSEGEARLYGESTDVRDRAANDMLDF
jgi:hypothetical protein